MTRLIDPGLSESQTPVISGAALAVSIALTGGNGDYNFCSADAPIAVNGTTYQPATFSVQPLEERDDGSVGACQLTFSLGEQDMVTVLKTRANYLWKPISIAYVIMIAGVGATLITAWSGLVASRQFAQDKNAGSLTIIAQDMRALLGRPGNVRFDSTSQKIRAPGDTFFDNAPGLEGQHIIWMGKTPGHHGGPGVPQVPGPGHVPGSQKRAQ